jgi:hypothetical protein
MLAVMSLAFSFSCSGFYFGFTRSIRCFRQLVLGSCCSFRGFVHKRAFSLRRSTPGAPDQYTGVPGRHFRVTEGHILPHSSMFTFEGLKEGRVQEDPENWLVEGGQI